jgi:hypothetical protein
MDMTRIILDESWRSKLTGFATPVELCDEAGRVVGMFVPAADYAAVERSRPPLSDEELDRRAGSASYATAEVLARLEKL